MMVGVSIQDERKSALVANLVREQGWTVHARLQIPGIRLMVADDWPSCPGIPVLVLQPRGADSTFAEHPPAPAASQSHVIRYNDLPDLEEQLRAVFQFIRIGADEESNHSLFYRAAVEYSHDGIICVDRDGIVHVFNRKASEVLGVPLESALGQELVSFNPTAGLPRVLEQKEVELEDVISINGRRVAANRAPIFVNGEVAGAISTFQDVTQLQRYEQTIRKRLSKGAFQARVTLSDMVAKSEVSKHAMSYARQCGQVDATVLITGESGTGKEMFAQGIHNASLRAKGPFVAVNCGALPETLLESELFGYDEGAFTGAQRGGKEGLFELAHGGTLFLDEIGEIPVAFQTKLLRVLQEHEVLRVGGRSTIPVDTRIIAATNQPLQHLVAQGRFRADLFYRLFVLNLHVPPLRDRREDIPPLVGQFLREFSLKYDKSNIRISAGAMEGLLRHDWPGNVRELRNIMERAVIVTREHSEVTADWVSSALYTELDMPVRPAARSRGPSTAPDDSLSDADRRLLDLYVQHRNVADCAQQLGIHRTTVWRRLKRLRDEGWIEAGRM